MSVNKMISIWFFIGCMLAAYGLLILIAGFMGSAGQNVAMQHLHLQRYWGVGMLALGGFYVIRFRP